MSEVTWRLAIDELYATIAQIKNDLSEIKQDMIDLRQDTTDLIDGQYEIGKKLDKLQEHFEQVRYME